MNITFKDKVALVTGAAGGLGFATAKAFAEAGASVVLADFDEKALNEQTNGLHSKGYKVLAVTCDVSNDEQVKALVQKTVATFGRLDIAYNNAGVQNELVEAAEQHLADFERVVGINLRGVWSCMKYELQQMKKQGSGSIVNCSSIGGIRGGAQRGTYHAAKHGVIGLTTSAAKEYASQGIRINSISPGLFDTPMSDRMKASGQAKILEEMVKGVPIGRVGRPDEIADAVLYLSSEHASMIVGHNLVVDGGLTV